MLGISAHTARHHTQRVLAKLKVHSRAEAGAKLRG
jgi:DNA-binding CsgD family transcriptional regulator